MIKILRPKVNIFFFKVRRKVKEAKKVKEVKEVKKVIRIRIISNKLKDFQKNLLRLNTFYSVFYKVNSFFKYSLNNKNLFLNIFSYF